MPDWVFLATQKQSRKNFRCSWFPELHSKLLIYATDLLWNSHSGQVRLIFMAKKGNTPTLPKKKILGRPKDPGNLNCKVKNH